MTAVWTSGTWVGSSLPAEGEPVEEARPVVVQRCAMCGVRYRMEGALDCVECRARVIAEEEAR